MSEVILVKVHETCGACPSQWDAWDLDGNYWYLRYRHSRGTAERQPSPDTGTWSWERNQLPNISFEAQEGDSDGVMDLETFCQRAGLNLHPDAERTSVYERG